jgi:hypothetical protein
MDGQAVDWRKRIKTVVACFKALLQNSYGWNEETPSTHSAYSALSNFRTVWMKGQY